MHHGVYSQLGRIYSTGKRKHLKYIQRPPCSGETPIKKGNSGEGSQSQHHAGLSSTADLSREGRVEKTVHQSDRHRQVRGPVCAQGHGTRFQKSGSFTMLASTFTSLVSPLSLLSVPVTAAQGLEPRLT